jgi:hypothetical protein
MKALTPYSPNLNTPSFFMKSNKLRLLTVFGAALVALTPLRTVRAADNNPPTKMTHQGFLTDFNGLPVGNSGPVNKPIIFRIFDAATGGNRLWAAQQVVTVDKGHYSVLLGEGSQVNSEPFSADLTGVFTGTGASDRFLEITVDGKALMPRLQLLPAPYAMLAKKAMTVESEAPVAGNLIIGNWLWSHLTFNSENAVIDFGNPGSLFIRRNRQTGNMHQYDDLMTIRSDGKVGIGTTTPSAMLTVAGAGDLERVSYRYLNAISDVHGPAANLDIRYSIRASGYIGAAEFNAISDQRIKVIQGRSDGAADLAKLMQIEITDYLYKDEVANGAAPQKKVLGQQVEKVYPQAVHLGTEVVPDIYEKASVRDGWIELATDLKKGERVKLISEKSVKVFDVEAVEPGRFRTAQKPEADKVFVYGREVKDFRLVDYDAIAMLNVSAAQELARQNEVLKKRVSELESRERQVIALQKRVGELEGLERQLAELQKLVRQVAERQTPSPRAALSENGPAAILPVSSR